MDGRTLVRKVTQQPEALRARAKHSDCKNGPESDGSSGTSTVPNSAGTAQNCSQCMVWITDMQKNLGPQHTDYTMKKTTCTFSDMTEMHGRRWGSGATNLSSRGAG